MCSMKVDDRIQVKGLVGASQYNGFRGTIRSELIEGRFTVTLDTQKELKIKPQNLELLTANLVHDLSVKELKELLKSKNVPSDNITEKADLISKVKENCSTEEIVSCGKPVSSSGNNSGSVGAGYNNMNYNRSAEMLNGMSPEQISAQMKQQSEMLRNNPHMFNQIVAQNPQLRGMTLEQVQQQLDLMANTDPEQLKLMAQMQQRQGNPGAASMDATAAAGFVNNMDPEQMSTMIRTQRDMLRNNPDMFETIKRQNPQMSGMTKEQVEQQLDMMAAMSPEQLKSMINMQQQMQSGQSSSTTTGAAPSGPPSPAQAADMMKNMDPEQLSNMMKMQRDMLEKNPEMFEQIMSQNPMMAGMSKDQVKQYLNTMADLPPDQLQKMMNMAQKAETVTRPLRNGYQSLNRLTNGNARFVLIFLVGVILCYIIERLFF